MNYLIALELVNFAPLIQFIAGVYLVCLYQDVFEKLPVTGRIEKLIKQTDGFKNRYVINSINSLGPELSSLWQNELKKIKRIFIVSTSFCIFLLGYIGCHHYNDKYDLDFNFGLIIVGGVVLVYTVWCFFSKKQNRLFLPFFWIVAYLLLFHLSRHIACTEIPTNFVTILLVKIVLVLGFIVLGVKSWEYHRKLGKFENVLSMIEKDVKIILDLNTVNKLAEASEFARNSILEELGPDKPNYDIAMTTYLRKMSEEIESIIKKKLKL
jgi:hypothetical protein